MCGRCNERHDLRLLDYYLVNDYECIATLHEKIEAWLKKKGTDKLNLCSAKANSSLQ